MLFPRSRPHFFDCSICDGFEAMEKRVGVLGDWDAAYRKARFMRTYSKNVVTDLHQISVATAHTAIAATHIHNHLPPILR
jgi:thioredoxin reductase